MLGRRSHARGDIRARARKNAASVPSAWLTTVSAIVMSAACRRNGRYFQATAKSSCMSGYPVDELGAEVVEAEVLLGPAVEQTLLAHRADRLVHLRLELGRGLLHGHADVADHIGLADDPRHAGPVLDEVGGRGVRGHRRLDPADLHVGEHLGVAGVAL